MIFGSNGDPHGCLVTKIASWLTISNFDDCEWCPEIDSGGNSNSFSTVCFQLFIF